MAGLGSRFARVREFFEPWQRHRKLERDGDGSSSRSGSARDKYRPSGGVGVYKHSSKKAKVSLCLFNKIVNSLYYCLTCLAFN